MKRWIALATAAGLTTLLMSKRRRGAALPLAITHGDASEQPGAGEGGSMAATADGDAAFPMGAGPGAGYGASSPPGDHDDIPSQRPPV